MVGGELDVVHFKHVRALPSGRSVESLKVLVPVALERWPDGWREGMRLSTAVNGQPQNGDGFYSKRLPKGGRAVVVNVLDPGGETVMRAEITMRVSAKAPPR